MASKEEMKNWLKANPLTPEILDRIIYKFDLQNVDLYIEKGRIEEKRSYLSARQRKAVMELCQRKRGIYKDLIIDKNYEYINISPSGVNKNEALKENLNFGFILMFVSAYLMFCIKKLNKSVVKDLSKK